LLVTTSVAYPPPYTSYFTPRVRVKPEPAFFIRKTIMLILFHSLAKACPSRTVRVKHKPPWCNTTLANLKRECRTYFNRSKYNKSESSWILYHTKLSLYKKYISKRRAWASFCSVIEEEF